MENLRLFLGLALPDDVWRTLGSRTDAMKRGLGFRKWAHPADYHITLHYLGNTPEERLADIVLAAHEAADTAEPLRLSLTDPGTFGPEASPRIFWCGVKEEAPADRAADEGSNRQGLSPLRAIHRTLGERLRERIGFEPEARPYHPHITLARSCEGGPCTKSVIRDLWASASESGIHQPPVWTIGEVTVFRSHLGRTPSYERLEQIPFTGRS